MYQFGDLTLALYLHQCGPYILLNVPYMGTELNAGIAEDLVQRNRWFSVSKRHLGTFGRTLCTGPPVAQGKKLNKEVWKAGVHLPTTVSSMLSRSRAMKTMKRISFLDCLSSLSHLIKLNCRSALNLPMMLVPKGENRWITSPSAERQVVVMGQ